MKAEVNKTTEVVLRMTEAEAKCLHEILRCVTVENSTVRLNGNSAEPGCLVDEMDAIMFHEVDGAFVGAGIR